MAVICTAQHFLPPLPSLIYCDNKLWLPMLGISFDYQISYQSNVIQVKREVRLSLHCLLML